jgi:hypothetical protein
MLADGAIGARFSPGGDRLYLTDLTGLGVYDFTDPGSPQMRWHLPLPRIDTALRGSVHLVDVGDPDGPAIVASRPAVPGLTAYDVRDLSAPFAPPARRREELAWVCADDAVFAFDVGGGRPPRLVLGGPGQPDAAHRDLLAGLQRARVAAWHGRGAAVALYVSTATLWAAVLAPVTDTSGRVSPAHAERLPLSPIGEWGRPASWGRGPVPSPAASA